MVFVSGLTVRGAARILLDAGLLREAIMPARDGAGDWTSDPGRLPDTRLTDATYDTRSITPGALLFCKGNFRPEYLKDADQKGLAAYVSQTDHTDRTHATGLIVTDARKAMAILSSAYWGRPQDKLTLIGITGTKGKTTTAYFTHAILNQATGGRCALLSSVDNCTDGRTRVESQLTTPDSPDLYRLMRQAVDNGMTHLVMEVSSQAYKVDRVHALHFDVAAFLNISPDHISPIEHPTYEDYLWCKRQIIRNTDTLVHPTAMDRLPLILEDARRNHVTTVTFAAHGTGTPMPPADIDATIPRPGSPRYTLADNLPDTAGGTTARTDTAREPRTHELGIPGDFNILNAAAATAIARATGIPANDPSLDALQDVHVPGRMERFTDTTNPHVTAYVDYAHNQASVTAILDFVWERYGAQNPRITLVTGSAGNKAYDRREGIVKAAQNRVARLILTDEDTDTEPMEHILEQMDSYVTNPDLEHTIIPGRATAIETAIEDARADAGRTGRPNIILAIGKGREKWIKRHGGHEPYEGDTHIFARVFGDDAA